MATADRPKLMWIPPPPPPEFYLPKEMLERQEAPSCSSSSSATDVGDDIVAVKEHKQRVKVSFQAKNSSERGEKEKKGNAAVWADGAYDDLPLPPYCSPYGYAGYASPSFQRTAGTDVPPLAVYHICRICLRPRSGRYHREHPIPIDGVPPPPGICRRCRVTSVKESSEVDVNEVDEVVRKGRSNEIKIGVITPFVPDDAVVSNQEANKIRAERHLRGRSRERHLTIFREECAERQARRHQSKARRDDIVYRHVRVLEEPSARRRTVVATRTEDITRDVSREPSTQATRLQRDSPPKSRQSAASAKVAQMDSSQVPSSSSSSTAASDAKVTTETVILKRPERTDSEIRRIAGEEARRYAIGLRDEERPESDIRRIAHEEVERYREAERKLESRPGAFAHGRLVPVQRHIEKGHNECRPMLWEGPLQNATPVPIEQTTRSKESEPAASVHSASYRSTRSRTRSDQASWGPQWRRELSLERCASKEEAKERWNKVSERPSEPKSFAPPSDLIRSDKPCSMRNVVRRSEAVPATSWSLTPAANCSQKSRQPNYLQELGSDDKMGFMYPPTRRSPPRESFERRRETIERLHVVKPASPRQRDLPNPAAFGKSKRREYSNEAQVIRKEISRSTDQREKSGGRARDSAYSSVKPWERGSEEHTAFLVEKERSLKAGGPPPNPDRKPAGTRGPDIQYEYQLNTVRPAEPSEYALSPRKASPKQSDNSDLVTLEVWQQVPIDTEQRAREAPMHEKERDDAVEWLIKRINDPSTQVGVDADGSRSISCSVYDGGSSTSQRKLQNESRHPSPKQTAPSQADSLRREEISSRQRSTELRGGGEGDKAQLPDRPVTVEVWEQIPSEEAARYRRGEHAYPSCIGNAGGPPREVVIEAWKQVPSDRPPASSIRRDSAMDTPPARRRKERRELPYKGSGESAHVKFATKVEISPTPPGSDESSNAFRRFHDFVGRKAGRQIDGHESERGEDLIAEYERRGRLRSRGPQQRKSEHRDERDRDETVKPRGRQRRYDGRRNDGWRPLQRALSESPSREWSERKRSPTKRGPPYHPDVRPTGSMTTRDGSRGSRNW